ncbi:conserved Plasmodium protein, unknown function [Plasmodium knowlesi strain H]|uniref:Immune mapped protein 2 N-terminal domain-containing protein n=3 Tax=Plasmodium knowlesi TaxID=5850 RepID=A0A5K1VTF0_PLAKH|nr:IMP1-like protein, putative [Plasmodium knowlesi strain H]OTN65968.1 Uncharacterized protein PKNOH_S100032600 [Plasmodium knowlesi]CAA9987691.1 IMP1-like protein, putative [Plasmodium knowlesi strain H]SBO26910.1 conserved Plasmodium protein, unknown function [Plasmodium knowlesi strain H]SBO29631.1 conserved Plasmodium protein, unknown function [Plasmodium knowlesi strain H]VVS77165.1 IMP1-like protein, putative [Plasmodium knowlesi strain H]|eukprot:XP_002258689.1 hypothetical protein, conserved in Plasmodium species [Plasmodium knowlesi strain H]
MRRSSKSSGAAHKKGKTDLDPSNASHRQEKKMRTDPMKKRKQNGKSGQGGQSKQQNETKQTIVGKPVKRSNEPTKPTKSKPSSPPRRYGEEPQGKRSQQKDNHAEGNKNTKKNSSNDVVVKEKMEAAKGERIKREGGGCFLCLCCGNNDDDILNELILEDESSREEEEREKRKKEQEEEEERQKAKERERLSMIEEEDKMRRLLEAISEGKTEEEKKKVDDLEKPKEQAKRGSRLIIKDFKPKLLQKKKPKFSFLGAASAPPPPEASACIGPPPEVKSTSVRVREGIYLIYSEENNGQLELHYSKEPIKGRGVLGYIYSSSIPDFYFMKNNMKQILLKDVTKIMQSTYVRDVKPYYECVINFIKMKKKFNGVLYFLPAFNAQPPPKLDVIFFDSKEKKLHYAPIEEEIEFKGNFIFVIQKGLPIFKEEIETEKLCSYVCSFGAFQDI